MTTPKLWPKLVDDAVHRHMSRWRLGEIAAVVREADTAWAAQVEAQDAELIKYIDAYIFMERDRDQCARERDAYKAERDALAARVAALEAALRPAWEALGGANINGLLEVVSRDGTLYVEEPDAETYVAQCGHALFHGGSARLIAVAVNAVRAARDTHP